MHKWYHQSKSSHEIRRDVAHKLDQDKTRQDKTRQDKQAQFIEVYKDLKVNVCYDESYYLLTQRILHRQLK